jgi:hypothetical protein
VNVCPPAVIVPDRVDPVTFAATAYDTVPLPLPELPPVIVIQPAFDVAVHVHPVIVVTPNDPGPPPDATLSPVGLREYAQATPAWLTVNVWPPAVIVPDRGDELPFASTEYDTVPLPLPELPPVIVIQPAFDAPVHVHPVIVVTANDPVAPPDTTFALVGLSEYVQAAPA